MASRWFPAALSVALLFGPVRAHADPAAAEALFREGRRLLDEGSYAVACQKFSESEAQDPASGTLINLALCYEKQGKLATAWATYRAAAALARQDGRADRADSAEQKAAELESRVSHLVFRLKQPVPGIIISWEAVRIGAGGLESPIPVDPGEYRVDVRAPAHKPWEVRVSIAQGETRVLAIPDLEPLPPEAVLPPGPQRSAPPDDRHRPGAWVLIAGGAGLASLGAGAAFGIASLNNYREARRRCPTHRDCDAATLDAWHSARTQAWISNACIGLGVVAGAASLYLLFQSSPREHAALELAPLPRGARIGVTTAF